MGGHPKQQLSSWGTCSRGRGLLAPAMRRPTPWGLLLAVVLLSGTLAPSAWAFSVQDHRALTEAAIDAATASGAAPGLAEHRGAVVHGATAEDLNLHVKWTGWHHFYRPEGRLGSAVRRGSDARVAALWEDALEAARQGDVARAWDRAGHLAHHLQDMASPPHVVPVNHGLTDRFEGYGVRGALSRLPPREVAPLSGADAQHALALETLAAVRTEVLHTDDGAPLPWSAFWSEPDAAVPGAFGVYGPVGNAFGLREVRWEGRTRRIPPEAPAAFMAARVASAVAYTGAFLTWAAQRFEEASLPDAPFVALRVFRPSPEVSLEVLGGVASDARGAAPIVGLRGSLPLPHGLGLSVDWTRGLGGGAAVRPWSVGGWAFSVLSPPLVAWRPGYAFGLDVRASAGLGVRSWEGEGARLGVPLGLRFHASLGGPFVASTEVLYQGLRPPGVTWAHGFSWSLGLGMALGDR